jgi:hypothetical protein
MFESTPLMSWECPACRSTIPHNPLESRPRHDEAYRCMVCRLDLLFDPIVNEMVLAPWIEEGDLPATRNIRFVIEPRRRRANRR